MIKICSNCKEEKESSEFYKSSDYGIQSICKSCKRSILQKWRAVPLDVKVCTRCKEIKSLAQFLKNKRAADGLAYECKSCKKQKDAEWYKNYYKNNPGGFSKWQQENPEKAKKAKRDRHLQSLYGLSRVEYEQLATKQNNLCAICKKPESIINKKTGLTKNLSVDHCHSTGKIRGLLCGNCNTAIGLLKENIVTCKAVISYLKKTIK